MSKSRSRRLRKKLRVGEYQELGFEVRFQLRDALDHDAIDRFWDAFILEAVERNGLAFGGGTDRFVYAWRRGSTTDAHRKLVRDWLTVRPEVLSVETGPLIDAWHSSENAGL